MINPAAGTDAGSVITRPSWEAPGAARSSGGARTKLVATAVATSAAALALLPLLLLRGSGSGPDPEDPPWPLPEFSGTTLAGESWRSTELAGRAAVLIYVDHECPYCKVELEEWQRLEFTRAESNTSRALSLWIVASPSSPQDDLRWLPHSFHTRTVWDSERAAGPLLGVSAVPTSFWVDPEGTVRIVSMGVTAPEELRRNIVAVTGGVPGPGAGKDRLSARPQQNASTSEQPSMHRAALNHGGSKHQ